MIARAASRALRSGDSAFGVARFAPLWDRAVVHASHDGRDAYAALERLLGARNRHFHNFEHIRDCVERVDEVAPLLGSADSVELALWFHDAVLDPGARDNERRSAELFADLSAGAATSFRHRIVRLILATAHGASTMYGDRAYVVDIDLAGLGAPWDEFMRKGDLLRREALSQSDDDYYGKQVTFLQRLLDRRWLYATDYFRTTYEGLARANLTHLLALRASQGFVA